MRTQVPRFRLPEEVIDEETGYILDLGVEFIGNRRIESMRDLLAQQYDAIFVGTRRAARARSRFARATRSRSADPCRFGLVGERVFRPHHQSR